MKYITVFFISLLMGCRLLAQDSSAVKLNQGLKDLNNKMDEIQKHYYEREMVEIKDSYSVGLNNMNYYITIVLGAVTILGVLIGIIGFKSIFDLKEKYYKELADLKAYREKSENEFNNMKSGVENELRQSTEKIQEELTNNRKDLNQYSKELELLQALINIKRESNKKNYMQAVIYAEQALILFPDNEELLTSKALCLGKSRRYSEAVETMQQIINKGNTQEKNVILWVNLAEICLLSKDVKNFRKFEQIIKNHEDEFQENRPSTTAYLKTYYHFLKGEMVEFKREINNFISNASICLAIERLGGSQMDEFYTELLNDSSPNKNIMLAFVDYLRGAKREEDLTVLLSQI
jgi:tetratricopeptide (TPR) repeat protein